MFELGLGLTTADLTRVARSQAAVTALVCQLLAPVAIGMTCARSVLNQPEVALPAAVYAAVIFPMAAPLEL